MKLYNTLTKQVENIQPINSPKVTVYTCGPTVYDYPHLGNWFTFVRYDLLIRTLRITEYNPLWVMNITDVGHLVSDADEGEDKLEKGARREGKTAWDIANFYSDYFIKGLERLNFVRPDYLPKATKHIEEQINLVKTLEEKGYTYVIDDGVYFDTAKFSSYADFAQLDIDEQQAGKRVTYNPQKRNPTDFALWKFSPKNQKRDMEWESPWGKGFPGWHLECSAMSIKYLGPTIDIHSGGIDHVPVHHTNEIAQSQAATGQTFAHYWMHTNHITVNGEKISKSAGNGITLEDIEAKGYSLQALRLHILESHYRSQSKFSWESIEAAENSLKNIQNNFSWIYHRRVESSEPSPLLEPRLESYKQQITEALQDDLNTPKTVAILHECANEFSMWPASIDDIPLVEDFANFIEQATGLIILSKLELTASQKDMIKQREEARNNKDWAKADQIREQLEAEGIGLQDRPGKSTTPYKI